MKWSNLKYVAFFIAFLTLLLNGQAQAILDLETFLNIVKVQHPIAKISLINIDMAKATRLEAGGAFDPILNAEINRKSFDGKNYYVKPEADLTLPTWFGIEVYGGVSNYRGSYLNAEESTGLVTFTGIKLPLLKDLYFDKRRAALQKAKIGITLSENERILIINDLLLEAEMAYWDWLTTFNDNQILDRQRQMAEQRMTFVSASQIGGDRSEIDTVEAFTQVLALQQLIEAAKFEQVRSSMVLSTFLWDSAGEPVYLNKSAIPDTSLLLSIRLWETGISDSQESINNWLSEHPKILSFEYKTRALEVERKLKFQSFLPKLDLKYNLLQKGNFNQVFNQELDLFGDNYKYGLSFSMPLINRTGLGGYYISKQKLASNILEQQNSQWGLSNKIRSLLNELSALKSQISLIEKSLSLHQRLLDAERIKFELGESTVFLLNAREMKLLETSRKLNELSYKLGTSTAKLKNAGALY